MKRKMLFMLGMLFLVFCITKLVYGAGPDVKEVLRASDRARGNLGGIIWNIMITTNEDGTKESRGMTVKVKGNNTLARFTSPANMNDRMVLMVDRNMWFIRSGLKKPVSLSPRQKLIGDAANGDIASTNYVEDYAGTFIGEEAVHGEPCYLLDLKAANKNVTYDRIKYWVSKERKVGVKAEFYTLSGKLFKSADFKYDNRIQANGDEFPFVSQLVIHDAIQKDRITTMVYSNIRIEEIPDSTFNLNVLVR
jgi:hypothetical protein